MPRKNRTNKENELEKATKQLIEAKALKERAKAVASKLERDRKQNHYADMVRRALWVQR